MNKRTLPAILGCAIAAHFFASAAHAGQQIAPPPDKSKIVEPADDWFPPGMITLGGKFSEDLTSGYYDSVTPLLYKSGLMLFLNTRTTLDDSSQLLGSYGLGLRYLVPDQEIIIGANVYYDSIESAYGNHFDQLGVGVELLTRWFDARANWYLPDNGEYEIGGGFTRTRNSEETGEPFTEDGLIKQRTTRTSERTVFKRYERGLEGYNLEGGFLVPGLDQYLELRLLAGYYHYEGGGATIEGFKARAEARFLPGVIGDIEYWDDEELVGGHWVAGVRVSVPFSIFNLFSGRNPFEGASDAFRPRKREFRERLSEMVIRSHRVQAAQSGPESTGTSSSGSSSDQTIGVVPPPPPPTKVEELPPT